MTAFVQVFPTTNPNTSTTLGPVTMTAKNFGLIVLSGNNNGSTITGITGGGNIWLPLSVSSGNLQIWYCLSLVGGSITTTFAFSGTVWPFFANYFLEYSGVGTSARLDATANASGTGTSQSVGPIPASKIELIVAALHMQASSIIYTPGGGYTRRGNNSNPSGLNAFDLVNAPAGSNTFTCTCSAGLAWQGTIAAFTSGGPQRTLLGVGA